MGPPLLARVGDAFIFDAPAPLMHFLLGHRRVFIGVFQRVWGALKVFQRPSQFLTHDSKAAMHDIGRLALRPPVSQFLLDGTDRVVYVSREGIRRPCAPLDLIHTHQHSRGDA